MRIQAIRAHSLQTRSADLARDDAKLLALGAVGGGLTTSDTARLRTAAAENGFEFFDEIVGIFEFAVDRREPDVGHVIDVGQTVADLFAHIA